MGQRSLLLERGLIQMSRSRWHVRSLMLGAALYACAGLVSDGSAQVTTAITSDGTLGTRIRQSGNLYNIDRGTIKGTKVLAVRRCAGDVAQKPPLCNALGHARIS